MTPRSAAQLGLCAASLVLVSSLGILVAQGFDSDASPDNAPRPVHQQSQSASPTPDGNSTQVTLSDTAALPLSSAARTNHD